MNLAEAGFPGRAETEGAGLDTFLNGMHASHTGAVPAVDTVIGHSYGSTLVIVVGSPGMLTEHAGYLNLADGANVYSMTARNDIISWATDMTLGADPFATDFGATRLTSALGTSWDPTEIIGQRRPQQLVERPDQPGAREHGGDHRWSAGPADHHARRKGAPES